MDHESEIIKNTQTLHSDMQTLVYENYNKFISATDTIRKVSLLFFTKLLDLFLIFNFEYLDESRLQGNGRQYGSVGKEYG